MSVEPATAEDIDDLTDLWVSLVESQRPHGSHLLADPNRAPARDVIAQYAVVDNVVVARGADGTLVGFVMFHVESGLYEQDATRGVIDNLYVRSGRRNEGVGSRLLAAAEASLADAGVDAFALSVMASNDAARCFYRERGYRPHRVDLEKSRKSDNHSKE